MQFTYVLRRKKRWKKLQCRHTPLSLDCGPSFRNMERLIADILGMLPNITLSLKWLTFIHNRHLLVECSKQHQSVRIFCFFRPLRHPCWCTEESHQHSGCIHSLLSGEKHTLAFNLNPTICDQAFFSVFRGGRNRERLSTYNVYAVRVCGFTKEIYFICRSSHWYSIPCGDDPIGPELVTFLRVFSMSEGMDVDAINCTAGSGNRMWQYWRNYRMKTQKLVEGWVLME